MRPRHAMFHKIARSKCLGCDNETWATVVNLFVEWAPKRRKYNGGESEKNCFAPTLFQRKQSNEVSTQKLKLCSKSWSVLSLIFIYSQLSCDLELAQRRSKRCRSDNAQKILQMVRARTIPQMSRDRPRLKTTSKSSGNGPPRR